MLCEKDEENDIKGVRRSDKESVDCTAALTAHTGCFLSYTHFEKEDGAGGEEGSRGTFEQC